MINDFILYVTPRFTVGQPPEADEPRFSGRFNLTVEKHIGYGRLTHPEYLGLIWGATGYIFL